MMTMRFVLAHVLIAREGNALVPFELDVPRPFAAASPDVSAYPSFAEMVPADDNRMSMSADPSLAAMPLWQGAAPTGWQQSMSSISPAVGNNPYPVTMTSSDQSSMFDAQNMTATTQWQNETLALPAPNSSSLNTISVPDLSLNCIFAVTLTYFLNYFTLACIRSKNQHYYPAALPSLNERIFEDVARYAVYVAPMLCVLFFEVVKRFEAPCWWLNFTIVACSVAFCLQALAYVCCEFYDKRLNSVNPSAEQPRVLCWVNFWRNVCNVSTLVQYLSVTVIISGGVWWGKASLPVGHKCTLILAATYMTVYLLLFVLRTHRSKVSEFHIEILKRSNISINFAPMLCVLFMSMQMVYEWGGIDLTPDIAGWMHISTYAVLSQVLFVPLAPILADAELRAVGGSGELDFVSEHNWVFVVFSLLRSVAMIIMCVGVCFLCNAFWVAQAPKALKVSLFYLSSVYFATYLSLWFVVFTDGFLNRAKRVLQTAKDTLAFCPMVCVLFLAVFVQARRFGEMATPQSYSQDWMIVGTAALLTQVGIIFLAGYTGKANGLCAILFLGFFVAMILVFAGVTIVAFGAFTINAQNANGEGAWFARAAF